MGVGRGGRGPGPFGFSDGTDIVDIGLIVLFLVFFSVAPPPPPGRDLIVLFFGFFSVAPRLLEIFLPTPLGRGNTVKCIAQGHSK